jgi:GT2 family glycosyltransferase
VNTPWLSVILPTYNGADYLTQTLGSMVDQIDDQVEVIAVDDGSTDTTLAILHAFCRRLPLRILTRGRIGNWVANTNYGLAQARGRYACFLHQDDLWLPGRLRAMRLLLAREPKAALVLHASRYIDARGRDVGIWRSPLPAGRVDSRKLIERLLVQNFIAVPAPLFMREAALRVGGLDEELWYTADWDFWLKLASAGPIVYYPSPLAAFRIHPASQTAQGVSRAGEMRRQIEVVLQKHLPAWEAAHPRRTEIGRVARLSLEVNYAMAACAYGVRPSCLTLMGCFLALGPAGWYRFFHDSRIVERLSAQVKARLAQPQNWTRLPFLAGFIVPQKPRAAVGCQSPPRKLLSCNPGRGLHSVQS